MARVAGAGEQIPQPPRQIDAEFDCGREGADDGRRNGIGQPPVFQRRPAVFEEADHVAPVFIEPPAGGNDSGNDEDNRVGQHKASGNKKGTPQPHDGSCQPGQRGLAGAGGKNSQTRKEWQQATKPGKQQLDREEQFTENRAKDE